MSCYYKALPRLIPQLLLLARPGREVILVSPWIQDVTLAPPMFVHGVGGPDATERPTFTAGEIRLGELLICLARDFNVRTSLLVRELDYRFERVVREWPVPGYLTVKLVPNLHAKAIVTDSMVLLGSANLLDTSLARNVELCELKVNRYKSASRWVKEELGRT